VINAAGYAAASDRSVEGLRRLRRDNVDGVATLAEAATSIGARSLIHISSVAAMGRRGGLGITEPEMAEPRNPYGLSKRDAEQALESYMDRLPVTILRPTSIYGERRGLTVMLCRVASLPVVPLPAGGKALVPLSYIGNLVEAVRLSVECSTCARRTFIVGDDESYRLGDVIRGLATRLAGATPRTVSVPGMALKLLGRLERLVASVRGRPAILDPVRIETLTSSISFSTEAFRLATGFKAPFTLDDGLDRVAASYREGHGS
jgi:nucleoside-diphosphate-sugar epimerase